MRCGMFSNITGLYLLDRGPQLFDYQNNMFLDLAKCLLGGKLPWLRSTGLE